MRTQTRCFQLEFTSLKIYYLIFQFGSKNRKRFFERVKFCCTLALVCILGNMTSSCVILNFILCWWYRSFYSPLPTLGREFDRWTQSACILYRHPMQDMRNSRWSNNRRTVSRSCNGCIWEKSDQAKGLVCILETLSLPSVSIPLGSDVGIPGNYPVIRCQFTQQALGCEIQYNMHLLISYLSFIAVSSRNYWIEIRTASVITT